MGNWICETCNRETMVSFRCDNCHRGVCRECITFKKGKQLCRNCAEPTEEVRIDGEPELVPA